MPPPEREGDGEVAGAGEEVGEEVGAEGGAGEGGGAGEEEEEGGEISRCPRAGSSSPGTRPRTGGRGERFVSSLEAFSY